MKIEFIHRIKLSVRKDRELYDLFYEILGFYPYDIRYYQQAVTHTSARVRDDGGRVVDNERLEFLGDAVLDSAVADILYKRFPDEREGFLTNTRSKIVQREHLNALAQKMGLQRAVQSGKHGNTSHNSCIYGNAIEALIGAIYLDRGYRYVKAFIEHKIIDKDITEFAREETNYKSRLIEWAQHRHYRFEFRLDRTDSDATGSPLFYSSVLINDVKVATAKGYTKKESHQQAAKRAMRKLHYDKGMRDQIAQVRAAEVATEIAAGINNTEA